MIFLIETLEPLASRMCLKMTCIYKGKGENQSADANPPAEKQQGWFAKGSAVQNQGSLQKASVY